MCLGKLLVHPFRTGGSRRIQDKPDRLLGQGRANTDQESMVQVMKGSPPSICDQEGTEFLKKHLEQ